MNSSCSDVEKRFSPSKAIRAQNILRSRVVLRDDFPPIRVVGGLDVAYLREGYGIGVAIALSYPSMKVLDCWAYVRRICVPYIPGLLAFREMAVLAPALARLLSLNPLDLVVVDGHGVAHPRGLGIASHVGVAFDIASIGVAKKLLYGEIVEQGGRQYIVDRSGRRIGIVLKRPRGSVIYVSPGHKVSVETAGSLVEAMSKGNYKLPEPTRIADRVSKELRRLLREPTSGYIRCSGSSSRSISFV